jgi:MFS superfamily sulfate permease-like transporter
MTGDDDHLQQLVRSALPRAADQVPARDLWPLVVGRVQTHEGWSWLDLSLVAIVTVVLLMFPRWLFLLAYHL